MTKIEHIRQDIEENHWQCIEPVLGGRGGFGEIFCGHIHELNMTFKDQAEHYGITLNELAELTADHIRALEGGDIMTDIMTSDERIAAGLEIAGKCGIRIHGNGCDYPITYQTPADNNEECTDLVIVFNKGSDFPVVTLPLDDSCVENLLSQCL